MRTQHDSNRWQRGHRLTATEDIVIEELRPGTGVLLVGRLESGGKGQ